MKLIILDRDGVINKESRAYIKNPDEWLPIPGSLEAIAKLTTAGYIINICTNQSAVARKFIDLDMLNQIHAKLSNLATQYGGKINKIYFCPHHADDNCECRKPKTAMLEQMQSDLDCKLQDIESIYVGDSLRDYQLANKMGCKFYLVTGPFGDGQETLEQITDRDKQIITIVDDLAEATSRILA